MDHSARAQSRIHWQYRNATKLREWIDTLPAIAETEIEEPAQTVAGILDIEARAGEQLDIIGRIVGIDRPANEDDDALFRLLIKARIERNTGDATVDNIVRAAQFVTGNEVISLTDNEDMTWVIAFESEIDSTSLYAFQNYDILPRPSGTRFLGLISPTAATSFGFTGINESPADNVDGFGEQGFHDWVTDSGGDRLLFTDGTDEYVAGLTDYNDPILPTDGGRLAELYEV